MSKNDQEDEKKQTKFYHKTSDIHSAIKVRLNRGKGIDKFRKKKFSVSKKLLETFTDEQLEEIIHLYAPLIGLKGLSLRRHNQVLIANLKSRRSVAQAIRAFLIDAMNIFQMTRKSKELLIHGIVTGTVTDDKRVSPDLMTDAEKTKRERYKPSTYYNILVLARENVVINKKNKKPIFPEYDKIITHLTNKEHGDAFFAIANDMTIDKDSKEYVRDVLKDARWNAKAIASIGNALVNERCELNNTPIYINGNISKYKRSKEDIVNEVTFDEVYTDVIKDVVRFTNADSEKLKKIL